MSSAVFCCSSNDKLHCIQSSSYTHISTFFSLFPKESVICSTSPGKMVLTISNSFLVEPRLFQINPDTEAEYRFWTSFPALKTCTIFLPPHPDLQKSSKMQLIYAKSWALPSKVLEPVLQKQQVPEESVRTIRQETPEATRQTLTWGESLAGSHVAPKSPGLPNCKRKGSKKARFTE